MVNGIIVASAPISTAWASSGGKLMVPMRYRARTELHHPSLSSSDRPVEPVRRSAAHARSA